MNLMGVTPTNGLLVDGGLAPIQNRRLHKHAQIFLSHSKVVDGNMSFRRGDYKETLSNRRKFLASQGLKLDSIICMAPIHGTDFTHVSTEHLGKGARGKNKSFQSDALITKTRGVNLFVVTGDCPPISFYDPKKGVICLIHAGWEGLDKGILEKTISEFTNHFGSNPKDILVNIGPSIGPCCYIKKLPKEVAQTWSKFVRLQGDGIYSINLWKFIKNKLIATGLPKENIYNPELCSYHTGDYFSHRKAVVEELPQDYRFATILGLR